MKASAVQPLKFSRREQLILSGLIGLVTVIVSIFLGNLRDFGSGDLSYSLLPAREWLLGKNPYQPYLLNLDPLAVPYPFSAILLAIPFAWLPDRIAAGIFLGFGSWLLAWLILRKGDNWRLLMFLSWPFMNNIIFVQWAPYITSMYFTPNLLLFLFTKPQLALPFVLTQKPSRIGIIIAGILVLISLVLYPAWPLDWLRTVHNFIGYPPLFVLPLGPLLLLALIKYRDKRSWLLVLLALMPQRMVYDQLGVLLVAENRNQMIFLVLCSWISLPAVIYFGGWNRVPWGWQTWVLIESYIPALLVLLSPSYDFLNKKISQSTA